MVGSNHSLLANTLQVDYHINMANKTYTGKKNHYADYIRGVHEKATPVRVSILAALADVHKPISIKEIEKIVTGFNESTLYRTLETLVQARLVRKVILNPSESLYETNVERPHHHHIVCTSCGFVEDVDICTHIPSKKTLKSKGFAAITDHSLEFFGVCKKCENIR